MYGQELIRKLEKRIEDFGMQFHADSDDYFWWEVDIQCWLLRHLLDDPCFWLGFLDKGGRTRRIPLAHGNCPAKSGQRRYDIATYEPSVADRIVREDYIPEKYPGEAKERPVLAAVEIARAHYNFYSKSNGHKRDIEEAFRRLVDGIDQFSRGYVVVAVTTYHGDKEGYCELQELDKAKGWTKQKYYDCGKQATAKIKVYWVSDHPQDQPTWLDVE